MKLILFDYSYFPYEKEFLVREIKKFGGVIKKIDIDHIEIDKLSLQNALLLTYVKEIVVNGKTLQTIQSKRERINGKINSISQSTRYGPHGLHEYKGKFNPQTPRSLLIQYFDKDSKVLDPFMGSGTTVVEARDLGMEAYGVELNPLAYEISKAKLSFNEQVSSENFDIYVEGHKKLPSGVEEYLNKWFTKDQFQDLTKILWIVDKADVSVQPLLKIILSDQLRTNSLQDPRDLRIRRLKDQPTKSNMFEDFILRYNHIKEVQKKWISLGVEADTKSSHIFNDDSTKLNQVINIMIDGTVCSPPYFSALPYIDTYRLSMVALEIISPKTISLEERKLIGARDITKKEMQMELDGLEHLPGTIKDLVLRIQKLIDNDSSAGFRKKAVPFNLIRYCRLMKDVLKSLHQIEKKGAINLWVVGPNKLNTIEGEFIINTPKIISDIAINCGYSSAEVENVDAYSRYDLHSKNSIRNEAVVKFIK